MGKMNNKRNGDKPKINTKQESLRCSSTHSSGCQVGNSIVKARFEFP